MADSKENMQSPEQKLHFDALMQLLSQENPEPITDLNINENLSDDQFALLCNALKNNTFVKMLVISRSNLSNKQLEMLGEVLKRNTKIRNLSINGCEVESTEALITFLHSLKENESLSIFIIDNIKFGYHVKNNRNNTIFKRSKDFRLDENFSISLRAPDAFVQALPKVLAYSHLQTFIYRSDDLEGFKAIFEKATGIEVKKAEEVLTVTDGIVSAQPVSESIAGGETKDKVQPLDQSSPQTSVKSSVKPLGMSAAPIKSLKIEDVGPGQGYIIRMQDTLDHVLEKVNCDDMNQRPTLLDLSNRTLNAEDLDKITAALSPPKNVRNCILELNLQGAKVDMDAFARLLEVLALHPTIQELNLNFLTFIEFDKRYLRNQDIERLFESAADRIQNAFKKLGANKILRKLLLRNLDRAFLLNDGLASFFEVLTANQSKSGPDAKAEKEGSKLFHLDLTGVGVTEKPQCMAKALEKLTAFCKTSPALEVLIFDIQSQFEAGPILQGLADNAISPLRRLEMSKELDRVALNNIVKILARNRMYLLDLYSCNINADGAKILAAALAQNESLEALNLSSNKIGLGPQRAKTDEGLNAIFKALSTNRNSTLQQLDLSYNSIKCTRFGRITADMLQTNQRLEQLNLEENELYDFRPLGAALKANHSLKTLNIYCHSAPITDVDLEELAEALKENKMQTENKTLQECSFFVLPELYMHAKNEALDDAIQAGLQRNSALYMAQFATALHSALDATPIKKVFQSVSQPLSFLPTFAASASNSQSKSNYVALSDAQAKAQKGKPPSSPSS